MHKRVLAAITRIIISALLLNIFSLPIAHAETQTQIIFHHTDHLGSSSISTDEDGNVIESTTYYPFGELHLNEENNAYQNPYKFTGKEQDPTGLYYYEARYYDPSTGRFISQDPWEGDLTNPQSFNEYSYVFNNPLKYTDPTGKVPIVAVPFVWKAGAAAVLATGTFLGIMSAKENLDTGSVVLPNTPPAVDSTPHTAPAETPSSTSPHTAGEYPFTPDPNAGILTTPLYTADPISSILTPQIYESPYFQGQCGVNMTCSESNSGEIPLFGPPNTTGLQWKDGALKKGRTWDGNGDPKTDYDFNDFRNPNIPKNHAHDWSKNPDGSFNRGPKYIPKDFLNK